MVATDIMRYEIDSALKTGAPNIKDRLAASLSEQDLLCPAQALSLGPFGKKLWPSCSGKPSLRTINGEPRFRSKAMIDELSRSLQPQISSLTHRRHRTTR